MQVYNILIQVIKSKFIAVLLGPIGVGIQGLYTSGIDMVKNLTSFGLESSAVRNVAEANGTGDGKRVGTVVKALRRLVWITGLLGMLAVIGFSPLLSRTSFGDHEHIWPFVILSVTLLLGQINVGQRVVIQGTRKLKYLARCQYIGVTVGLLVAVPLYYWLGLEGIVPNLLIASVTSLLLSWYYSRKIEVEDVPQTARETFSVGKTMLTMGIVFSLTQLLTAASAYALRTCIRYWEGVDAVGLFMAGYVLMTQYTGLVFTAMATDYYPRLAGVNTDNVRCREVMNQQGEVGILLLAPLMLICVVFVPFVVRILYSEAFLPVNNYIVWCAGGMLFKMASWAISYIFIAKAESKLFLINETVSNVYCLAFNLLGYWLGGLTGIGISFAASYLVYLVQVYVIAHRRYGFSFSSSFKKLFLIQFVLLTAGVIVVLTLPVLWKYVVGSVLCVLGSAFSVRELNKRTQFVDALKSKLKK